MKSQMKSVKIAGMSKLAMLIIVFSLVVFGTAALKLGPHYIDFEVIQGILERLPDNSTHKMSRKEIGEHFSKQFRVENFAVEADDVLVIERSRDQTVVKLDYEVREPLFYNIDVVLTFQESRTFN